FNDVAADAAGNFIVIWTSVPGPNEPDAAVMAQRYNASGAPVGGNFEVNSYTTGAQASAGAAYQPDGSFVAAFFDYRTAGGDLYAKPSDAGATPIGVEFRGTPSPSGRRGSPDIVVDSAGTFVIAWTDRGGADGSAGGVKARRYTANGTARGDEFLV